MRLGWHGFLAATALAALIGCRRLDQEAPRPDLSGRNLRVLATTGMIADAVREVGGPRVEVECLMGPGIDPHLFIASPRDAARIEMADLVLYNGLHLEGKLTDLLEERSPHQRRVAVAEHLPNLRRAEEGFEGTHDPHVWMDVQMWMGVVERIRDSLIESDPAHADGYRERAGHYLSRLKQLDQEVRTKLSKVPAPRRVLITAHDAFGYFGRAYGFEVRGLQGISTASDASARDVQALADLIGSRRIPAVFAEASVPSKGLEAVQQAVRSKYKGFEVRLAADVLYSDSLGTPGSPGETYIGMIRHNVDAIVRALGDSVPD